ncbi:hypothetical protein MKUB_48050 [Mycobacterium kubicae]|uniref:Uncharacterized protein n=1 Tax=Mycobacterium kubicae TaxID=120959 RepID=A0ABQ1BUY7_9MYCO|nr:hypothetical protein MKUB_48050 [Mycobacterium kubicae]
MTTGPDRSVCGDGATAATGVIAVRTGVFPGKAGGAPPTAPAKINGVMTATPKTGVRAAYARCRTFATAG